MDLSVNPGHFAFMFGLFLATLLVLNVYIFKPTLAILKEREHRLKGMAQEAEFFLKQHEHKCEAYKNLMGEAKILARQKREEILKLAEIEQREILTEATHAAETFIQDAKANISKQTKEASLHLKTSAESLANGMVEKLLKRQVA